MPDAPFPLIEIAIEPVNEIAAAQLREALPQLAAADPAFTFDRDAESGQTVIKGASEAHLEHKVQMLRSIYETAINVSAPQVAYRETLTQAATVKYTHKKVVGASGQFAEVTIAFAPLPPGSGFAFESAIADGAIPGAFIPSVESGLRAQMESGLFAGFPVIDFKATLVDGKYHEVDSNLLTFNIAARAAFRELAAKKVVAFLEPVMRLEIATPEDSIGGVTGDLMNRRASRIEHSAGIEGFAIVAADVPLANLFGYGRALLAMTQGRARFTMQFNHYAPVPFQPVPIDPFQER